MCLFNIFELYILFAINSTHFPQCYAKLGFPSFSDLHATASLPIPILLIVLRTPGI